jgi:quercetin dioxygenase-like cupin family protein
LDRQQRWLEVRPPGGQTAITLVLEDSSLKAGSMTGMILRAAALEATVAADPNTARSLGVLMSIVRREDRPVAERGPLLPTLQRLVDRASGSAAVTILINAFTGGEAVPEHTHEVEEVLLVTVGECTVTVDGRPEAAKAGDAVIVKPGARHAISHHSDQPCTVIAVLASPDAQVGAIR